MSLTGELEQLPIVDVIQLMNSTRKSGVLTVGGRKGESQLVFKHGFIVSASHLGNSVRIGEILLERGAVTQKNLDRALVEQIEAGSARKPLIVTLLELGMVEEKAAYAGLQALIEMTIVEILSWKKGTFVLDASPTQAPDGYQYYPQNLSREINIDTQGVLMDALRIFDEKVRDGEICIEDESEDALEITADDLGLSDFENLERKIPGVYLGLDDQSSISSKQAAGSQSNPVRRINEVLAKLQKAKSPQELALMQLRFASELFPRALNLIVGQGELIAERSVGVKAPRDEGETASLGFRIPLSEPSLLSRTVQSGELYSGPCDDAMVSQLYSRIAPPETQNILLLPVQSRSRTIFMTYADFGDDNEKEVSLDLLQILLDQSGEALTLLLKRGSQVKKAN